MTTETLKSAFAVLARIGVEVFTANRPMHDEAKWKLMKAMEDAATSAVDNVARIAAIFQRKEGDP